MKKIFNWIWNQIYYYQNYIYMFLILGVFVGALLLFTNWSKWFGSEEAVIPQVVVTYPSETEFVNKLTLDQVNVEAVPTFNIKGIKGDSLSISDKGVVTIYKGKATYQIVSPKEMNIGKVNSKSDVANAAGKAKVDGKEKNLTFWVNADATRELGAYINKAGKVIDNKKDKANIVSLTPVPVVITDTIPQNEMLPKHTLIKELPVQKKK